LITSFKQNLHYTFPGSKYSSSKADSVDVVYMYIYGGKIDLWLKTLFSLRYINVVFAEKNA